MWGHRKGGPPSGELRVFTDIFVLPLGHRTKKEGEIVRAKNTGFTIVELLIVIVVIGVLAAISIAAYTNITQRANNTATINAVSQTVKAIQAYMAANGEYPTQGNYCITTASGCVNTSGTAVAANSSFNEAMKTVAQPPTSVPNTGTVANGIYTNYAATRTYKGEVRPLAIIYFLDGTQQQCGVSDVAGNLSSSMSSSTSGYSGTTAGGETLCVVSIPAL